MYFYLLLTVLALLQVLDWYTTSTILKRGGYEKNKIIKFFMDKFGVTQTLIVKGIFVVLLGYFYGLESLVFLYSLIFIYVVVIVHNFCAPAFRK